MSLSPDIAAVARYVEQVAPLLGLPIPAACRDGVVRNLAGFFAAGHLLDEFPVGDSETAPVFRP
jgi:hypothetical protein